MIERDVFYYLSSKVFAAAVNLAAVATFARLAGPAIYGEYLVAFAWAYIVYGFSIQWLRFAFFARYRQEQAPEQISTFVYSLLALMAIITVLGLLVAAFSPVPPRTVGAVIFLVLGLSIYDSAHEIGRTRLRAGAVAQTVILRSLLMLILGAVAVVEFGTPLALAVGLALAHLFSIAPLMGDILANLRRVWSRPVADEFVGYGWPLVIAFGVTSAGQNIDRLLLAAWSGVASVGPYGAVNDLIKQCFVVVSEAIAGAYITTAKGAALQGEDERSREVLEQAFCAYTAVAAFGAAFVLRFGDLAIDTLLGHAFREPTHALVPLFVLSSVFMVFRSFYFGQVIFFARSSKLELVASTALVATVGTVAYLLVPTEGAWGAAVALTVGQIVACLIYMAAGSTIYEMPMPWRLAGGIAAFAVAGYLLTEIVERLSLPLSLSVPLNAAILLASFAAATRVYNLLGLKSLVGKLMDRRETWAAGD